MIAKGNKLGFRKMLNKIIFSSVGIFLGSLFLFPIYILVLNSFKNTKGIFLNVLKFPDVTSFTLENYPNSFKALNYVHCFVNSLLITAISTILILLISSMAAWVLVRHKTRISKVIFFIFAASIIIPFQCLMLPLVGLASRLHIMTPAGLIFMYMGFGSSMTVVMFHGFIKNIPEELEEAATLDGCNSFRLFFNIVIPLMKTILVTVGVMNVMWIWNDFLLPFLIINKLGWQTLPLKTYLFFGQYAKRWDLASAGLIMCIIPVVIFYMFCQKYIIKGITDGAIK